MLNIVSRGAIVLAFGSAAILGSSSAASAHHPEAAITTVCNTQTGLYDGVATVRPDAVRGLKWKQTKLDTVSPAAWVKPAVPTAYVPDSQSFTMSYSGAQPGSTVKVTVRSRWSNGVEAERTISKVLPVDCKRDMAVAIPSATPVDECGPGNIRWESVPPATADYTVAGTATTQLEFTLRTDIPGVRLKWEDGTVAPKVLTLPADSNEACAPTEPAGTVAVDCSGFVVTLNNTTKDPLTYSITTPSGNVEPVAVNPGETRVVRYPVIEDATSTVTVTAPGFIPSSATYTANCVQPPVVEPPVVEPPTTPEVGVLPESVVMRMKISATANCTGMTYWTLDNRKSNVKLTVRIYRPGKDRLVTVGADKKTVVKIRVPNSTTVVARVVERPSITAKVRVPGACAETPVNTPQTGN